ncbi:anti-sigma factor [Janthinobacterium sp. 17J80-10]|uniref:anti-sigma factor n=1 Tax=Janthinobacterium sp. 17J80-10 TaxID=2497863 RepID=UPI00100593F9|nr:anti-sigma factor [Janthinobacterium sp. 17J80-10]QAU33728.1 hypothetical protein EKL02_05755 [Janthinobacterium sp. 17J80-10]
MNIRDNDSLRNKLAAEYVLGTLRGGARRRFESWLKDDANLRRETAEWHDRLAPLGELAPAVTPPARVWQAVEHKLWSGKRQPGPTWLRGLTSNLQFWRNLAIASSAMATILLAVMLTRPLDDVPAASYVAALADAAGQTTIVITGDSAKRRLVIKVVSPQSVAADKSLELWALPTGAPPRSLGLVAANGASSLPFPADLTPDAVPALAISLEPRGGSPNRNAPSGPVLFKGAWIDV